MFNHLKVKIYPSKKAHNLKWKNVISVNTVVYDKEDINNYYSLPILELKLQVPAKCKITLLPVLLPNLFPDLKHINQ